MNGTAPVKLDIVIHRSNRIVELGSTDVFAPCSPVVSPNTDFQQPGRGLHSYEERDAHGSPDVLASCSPAVSLNTDIQRPGRGLHLYEQRVAHGSTVKSVPTRHTRSVGSKVVLSRRRH